MIDAESTGSCCSPQRSAPASPSAAVSPRPATSPSPATSPRAGTSQPHPLPLLNNASARHDIEQIAIPAGTFTMGDSIGNGNAADGERPLHHVELTGFSIDATSVTNQDFARFVDQTGYLTEAEQHGNSAVFHLAVDADEADILGPIPGLPWWINVSGANWRYPGGPRSGVENVMDHPVVHVSWNDALAYCQWAGRQLPTEAQWEYAARGGIPGAQFPWGEDPIVADGAWRANIFQGSFPGLKTGEDGWITTAPVREFAPNDWGVWNMVGNVWEWCADWFSANEYRHRASRGSAASNPAGPADGSARVLRGGSYLCHDSYCNRYRNSARSSNTPDSSMANAGFRTVSAMPPRSRNADS